MIKRLTVFLVLTSFVLSPFLSDLSAQTHKKHRRKKAVAADTTAAPKTATEQAATKTGETPEGDCETAKIEGAKEGSRETNSFAWGAVSFLLPLPGVIVAAVADPGMPSHAALANTNNQTCFTEGYRNKKKGGRLGAAVIGGILGVATALVIIASSNSSSSQ